jgi:hypothetical protein
MEFVVVALEAAGSLPYTHTQRLFALDSRLDTLGDCRVVGGGTEDVCTNARDDVVLASLALHTAMLMCSDTKHCHTSKHIMSNDDMLRSKDPWQFPHK